MVRRPILPTEHDIRGLDVAVDDPRTVCIVQTRCNLLHDLDRLANGYRPAFGEYRIEGPAF
jgi:hypothetical protein